MIPANDFSRQWADLRTDAMAAFERVGARGWYVLGEEVASFEKELADLWGLSQAIGVASGLDAIEISLRALGCGPGDRVLTTPLSAFATTLAIAKLGAVPVFVDTDERGLIDLERCQDLLSRRPEIRYCVPVHLYGQALNPVGLRRLRFEFGLRMVEDCAQSIGATFTGVATGLVGDAAATSFYPTKNFGAMGDGGAVLTNGGGLAEKVRAMRDYGQTSKYRHALAGYNSRLDELQAAYLRSAVLPRFEHWTARRREIANLYLPGLSHPNVRLPHIPLGSDPCWHLFPVMVDSPLRESFLSHMKQSGIGTGVHYPLAIPDQPAMQQIVHELADACVNARRICSSEVSLPIHPYLTNDEVQQVILAVNQWQA